MKLPLDDLDLAGRRVLVRVDFNVPHEALEALEAAREAGDGAQAVADDTRIRASLPTIRAVTEAGGKAVLMSHLGRPKGQPDPKLSLEPVARRLGELLGASVRFVSETVGAQAEAAAGELPEGAVLLLENTRFQPGEKENDPEFAQQLARLSDGLYVNDAFGAAHGPHPSTESVTHFVERAAMGRLMERELKALSRLLEAPEHPFVAVLGGVKVSDKLGVIKSLLDKTDRLLTGGAMSYTFLKALAREVGASRVEEDRLAEARDLYEAAGEKMLLPTDHVVAQEMEAEAETQVAEESIPEGWMGLDIGPETRTAYREALAGAQTVVWNGPMGVFELAPFAEGTRAVAEAGAAATGQGAYTVVGGGDSVAALHESGQADRLSHVPTGGGAMLAFLEGKPLPGVAALTDV